QWMKKGPSGTTAYAMFLSTLVRLDQEAKANETIERWLKAALTLQPPLPKLGERGPASEGILSPPDAARMSAAINQAVGQGHNLYTNRMDERWYKLLAQVVLHFARDAKLGHFADQPMNHGQFQQTDEARAIRKETADILAAEIGKLPAGRVNSMVNWLF